jgi:hypothetical protein
LGTREKRFEWEAIFSRNALIISADDRFVLSVTVEISIGWLSDSSVSALKRHEQTHIPTKTKAQR